MTQPARPTSSPFLAGAALVVAAVLAACGDAAGASAIPSSPTLPSVTPTPVPGAPGNGGLGGGGTGGSGGGNGSGGGVVQPPGGGGPDPLLGQAIWVIPVAGQRNPHPVNIGVLRAAADGRHVTVELRWWTGVAPCSVLDSVTISTDAAAHTVLLTAVEGSGAGDVACIDIAQLTATTVDLGELAAGSWTIRATGDAPSVTLDLG